jgi:hypothetical protein
MADRLRRHTRGIMAAAGFVAAAAAQPSGQSPSVPADTAGVLGRVSRYVEHYYNRAQSLMAEEIVTLQHLRPDLAPDGRLRRLVYELRVEWTPGTDGGEARATVVRQLLRIGSRPARPGDKPECLDPRATSPEPLAFLLREQRDKFTFNTLGRGRVGRREALMLAYQPSAERPPVVTGDKTCITMDLPGRSRGRVWVDPDTDAILRLDESLVGPTDVPIPRALQSIGGSLYITVDRSDTSTVYQPVVFNDPEETLMLPSRIDSVSVIRASGTQRLRVTQEFRNYRRFLTDSRIVPEALPVQ